MSIRDTKGIATLHLIAAVFMFGLALVAAFTGRTFVAFLFLIGGASALLHRKLERLDDREPPGS
jgi:hypothetical protein